MTFEKHTFVKRNTYEFDSVKAENTVKTKGYNTSVLKLLTPIELGAKST